MLQKARQPQSVMMHFIMLEPGQSKSLPAAVYSGSILEFYGFEDGLYIEYGFKEEKIAPWDGHAIQTAVAGPSGKGFHVLLINRANKHIMGKVHVISTPRTRSNQASYREELY